MVRVVGLEMVIDVDTAYILDLRTQRGTDASDLPSALTYLDSLRSGRL